MLVAFGPDGQTTTGLVQPCLIQSGNVYTAYGQVFWSRVSLLISLISKHFIVGISFFITFMLDSVGKIQTLPSS